MKKGNVIREREQRATKQTKHAAKNERETRTSVGKMCPEYVLLGKEEEVTLLPSIHCASASQRGASRLPPALPEYVAGQEG